MCAVTRSPLVGYDSQTKSQPHWAQKAIRTATRRGIVDIAADGVATAHAITVARGT